MTVLHYVLRLLDPQKVIACYTVFLVVRAVETEDELLPAQICPEHMSCEVADMFTDDNSPLVMEHTEPYGTETAMEWWGKVFTPKPKMHSKCELQVQHYLRDLKHYELWAMQMWDATAKPAAGLLSGNSNQLGDYDSCLAVELTALGAVQGKYCLADIDLETSTLALPSIRVAVHKLQAGAFVRSKHSNPGHFAPRWTTLRWGLCVPAACEDSEVEAGLQHFLHEYQLPGLTIDAVIKPGMCYTNQQSHLLPLTTLATLGLFGGILLLSVVSTMVDANCNFPHIHNINNKDRALLAFSLRRSWKALLSRHADELPVIHGLRSVFTMLLFAAHKLMPLALTPYSNRALLTQYSHSVFSAVLRASSVFTDSFLQLSGVLTAYNMSREMSKNGSIAWKQRILARIIRLTPALFAVVLFYAYVMEHLGTGPQWTSSVTANADICKAHLWRNILYIQNFFLFEEMTHQLALDMQLSLIAPIVIYSLHRWLLPSLCLLGVAQLAVSALRYFTFLHYHLSDFIYHNISITDLYRNANLSYSQAIYRAIPYSVGLLTGFFLQRNIKIQFTNTQAVVGWSMCVLLATLSVFYPSHLVQPDAVYDVSDGAWYAAISPITWSIALAWFIITCSSGHGGWLYKVLCQHWLVVISRLSYAIYLTQFIIFYYYVGSIRSSQEFSLFYTIGLYELFGVLLASLVITLLFDLPMQEIKSILLSKWKTSRPDKIL